MSVTPIISKLISPPRHDLCYVKNQNQTTILLWKCGELEDVAVRSGLDSHATMMGKITFPGSFQPDIPVVYMYHLQLPQRTGVVGKISVERGL